MDGTGSESCLVAGFVISGFETLGSAACFNLLAVLPVICINFSKY
jgi:hypothetical protein